VGEDGIYDDVLDVSQEDGAVDVFDPKRSLLFPGSVLRSASIFRSSELHLKRCSRGSGS
jgi:hypothetical protein